MSNIRYTYRIKSILSWIILWEIVFWGIYFGVVSLFASSGKLSEDNGLIYKSPESLYLLIGIIPIIGTYIYRIFKHNNTVKHIHIRVMKSVLQPVSSFSSFIRYIFFRNAFALLIIAVSLPIFGTKKVSGTSETLELVVALDISNSMNTHDISKKISRLEIAKRALVQLVNNLHGEKIGLCLFAHNAFVQLPITRDYSAAKLFIKEIESGMISHQGTNIDPP